MSSAHPRVTVVGAGKMGLPLACQFARNGATVIACDVNRALVDAINRGECLIDEPGIPELLAEQVKAGRLSASTDTAAAAAQSEVIVVIVPAILTERRTIDLSILESASRLIARGLKKGAMVSYETTVAVGTTRDRLRLILEASGLKAGQDFDLVFSPERVKSQLVLRNLTVNPKIVGGFDAKAGDRAEKFYGKYLGAPVIRLGSLEESEFAKLAGMIYRDTNIALSNELARYAESVGMNIHPVIQASNTDGEAYLLQPGIGVGGHCTPVYPYFLIRDAMARGTPVTLAERARRINDLQASAVLDRVEREWGRLAGKRALILGLAFRPQVKEHIYSTAFLLREDLARRGATVRMQDPLYSPEEMRHHGFEAGKWQDGPEVVILNTAHDELKCLDFRELARAGVRVVVDGRNAWSPRKAREAGLVYVGVGQPSAPGAGAGARKPVEIPVARPLLGTEEAEAAADVVRSGWVFQGPQVEGFEREFGAYTGARHALAVANGTAALHLALKAVGVGPGDEVVTVSHSFIATANSIRYCGAEPVFVDIEPGTFNIDPKRIEKSISRKTKAILCVHQIGMPCDLEAILSIARKHGLKVVEDAACAIGSEIRVGGEWQRIGRPHGDVACFSFHPRKILTTGEGGMITTNDAEADRLMRLWRAHGMASPESFPELGYNYRMTDIQAAIGREQLKRIPALVAERRAQAEHYRGLLGRIAGLGLPAEPAWARSNWQSYCVRLPDGASQERAMEALARSGIATRRGIACAHRQPPYRECAAPGSLVESERAQDRCLILPLYPEMSELQREYVAAKLAEELEHPGHA